LQQKEQQVEACHALRKLLQGAQVGITTRREQDYISLTDMVQRQH